MLARFQILTDDKWDGKTEAFATHAKSEADARKRIEKRAILGPNQTLGELIQDDGKSEETTPQDDSGE